VTDADVAAWVSRCGEADDNKVYARMSYTNAGRSNRYAAIVGRAQGSTDDLMVV
jgi:hypothetical protein